MLLVYTQNITSRFSYAFKHIFLRVLGIEVDFTSSLEDFIAYKNPKLSYGKQALGNELFFQSVDLLFQQGIEDIEIQVKDWNGTPIFFSTSDIGALPFDAFAATFYLLSRYEEYLPHVKDEKGRFPASESLAFKYDFLEMPIVDIWAYRILNIVEEHFPDIERVQRNASIHNLLLVQKPYVYNQRGLFRSTIGYIKDIWKLDVLAIVRRTQVLVGARKDPYDTFTWIVNIAKRNKANFTAFFLLGEADTYYEGMNTYRNAFKQLIKYVGDYREIGLLCSANTIQDYGLLKDEIKRLESITNRTLKSSMHSNILVNLPDNYRALIELEIRHDFTMCYHDTPGFRAGSCTPFLFYDLDYEIKTPLILNPVTLLSSSISSSNPEEVMKKVDRLLNSVRQVRGTFSMAFSNTDFTGRPGNKIFRKLFSETLQQHEEY